MQLSVLIYWIYLDLKDDERKKLAGISSEADVLPLNYSRPLESGDYNKNVQAVCLASPQLTPDYRAACGD